MSYCGSTDLVRQSGAIRELTRISPHIFADSSPCTGHNCQYLCLPSPNAQKRYTCVCPNGYVGTDDTDIRCMSGKCSVISERARQIFFVCLSLPTDQHAILFSDLSLQQDFSCMQHYACTVQFETPFITNPQNRNRNL